MWTILGMQPPTACPRLQWDIFCRVIDNFGDVGVCWRLAVNLAQCGQGVRLWLDDARALRWMAPWGASGVQVLDWKTPLNPSGIAPGDVLVEAFGCEIDPFFIAAYATYIRANGKKCLWLNLEYLSAEPYVQRCHSLPSPMCHGPGAGLTKHFFYPGFTPGTGGLLREINLTARQAAFDRHAWRTRFAHAQASTMPEMGSSPSRRWVSLFCYEPPALDALLDRLADDEQPSHLLVTAGRANAAVQDLVLRKNSLQPNWNKRGKLYISYLSALSQDDFDHVLWACDLNFVRGEDSLVRALWAGQALVWQIYSQGDGAHCSKLDAFLDWLQAAPDQRELHHQWNRGTRKVPGEAQMPFCLSAIPLWQKITQAARARLLSQEDLATQMLRFVSKNH